MIASLPCEWARHHLPDNHTVQPNQLSARQSNQLANLQSNRKSIQLSI
jgi:hypothetical protein